MGYWDEYVFKCSYGKNLKKSPSSKPRCIQHQVLKYYQIWSNDDTVLTLIIFMTWSDLFRNASAWVKAYTASSHVFPRLI